ncbi:MAG: aromatic-ring-hydroxylating dioxygenase subunit beta [Cycloclasticus sp.]|nr:MAG: aromatic-ring-hydroxylating dioxygenase subunit beta [Cycloclasticus sp.]
MPTPSAARYAMPKRAIHEISPALTTARYMTLMARYSTFHLKMKAEDPQSRTRHFVTNLRVTALDNEQYQLKTNLMLYRNRSDDAGHDLLSAERHDVIHQVNGEWRMLKRTIYIDQATLGTLNFSIFL